MRPFKQGPRYDLESPAPSMKPKSKQPSFNHHDGTLKKKSKKARFILANPKTPLYIF
jgi:hypothetical protein